MIQMLTAIHSALHDGIQVCGTFSASEMAECSNVRELPANLRTTQRDMRVTVDRRMDNMGAVQALGGIIPSDPNRIFVVLTIPAFKPWH